MAQYVVKAGDSYAKIAGQKLGDQRGFGDLARLNGYRMLRPGDVIEIPGQRRQDYFVSDKDVQFAQGSTNSNYKGPVMQRYGDYKANYAAAQAAGQAGVYGAQNFTGTGANAGAGQGVSVNWKDNKPYVPSVAEQAQASLAQQMGAMQQQKTQAVIDQAKQVELGLPGTMQPGTPTPQGFVESISKSYSALRSTKSGVNTYTSPSTVPGRSGTAPQQSSSQNETLTPAQQAIIAQQSQGGTYDPYASAVSAAAQGLANQNRANAVIAALDSNTNVPTYVPSGAVSVLYQQSTLRPELGMALNALYDLDDNGNFVAKGSLLLPGAKVDLTSPDPSIFVPDTYDYTYSNVPPSGYDSRGNVYSTTGRRARGGRPTGTKTTGSGRYFTKDYNVRLGQ